MRNPDKHIRKFFVDQLNEKNVDGKEITIHDFRIPKNKDFYILMTNQSTDENFDAKCGKWRWTCNITLDIVTIYDNYQGSRLFADEIKEMVMNNTNQPIIDHFNLERWNWSFPDDLTQITNTQSIFRKLINYEFILTE